jgi:type VI secretion system protein VasD
MRLALALLGALALQACGTSPPPPAVLELGIAGSEDQNPNPSGKATPVAVHLYQLASLDRFQRADVFALIEREQATLGTDLLGSEEVVITPGEKQDLRRELKKGATALGIAVLYQDIDNAQWRASAPVAESGPTRLALSVGRLAATLKPAGK